MDGRAPIRAGLRATAAHWDAIYASRPADSVGWYESVPSTLDDVLAAASSLDAKIVDVGAGASLLADELLARGYDNLLLVDVSAAAFDHVRARIAAAGRAMPPTLVADVTTLDLNETVDVWHDRAVFHFLTEQDQRAAYLDAADRSVRPGGSVVVSAFSADGPPQCAGLPVAHYAPDELGAVFADRFVAPECRRHQGAGGDGDTRPYSICRFRKSER